MYVVAKEGAYLTAAAAFGISQHPPAPASQPDAFTVTERMDNPIFVPARPHPWNASRSYRRSRPIFRWPRIATLPMPKHVRSNRPTKHPHTRPGLPNLVTKTAPVAQERLAPMQDAQCFHVLFHSCQFKKADRVLRDGPEG
ncbi:hypothetical protein JMJ77_0013047 [Colletotrichum scovillei]|uniref:Uncharacterized protein n=1 Tax=Colletotrichum scovillei TaxID=1209932 RepID=A0A9P7R696_9PEZI|nr:hypothetical protein JMJ77_0013047 [Colletotrichum scovillei]KAG7069335.1 hypothetical protein JMJ76_0003008 [Colletotrichum scovillei]KAG7073285.1 hypothetical protein JMJ78_0014264 [Colletotrichum scovillei]